MHVMHDCRLLHLQCDGAAQCGFHADCRAGHACHDHFLCVLTKAQRCCLQDGVAQPAYLNFDAQLLAPPHGDMQVRYSLQSHLVVYVAIGNLAVAHTLPGLMTYHMPDWTVIWQRKRILQP